MAKKEGFSPGRSFIKHLLRGGLKAGGTAAEAVINPAKWGSVATQLLDEMTFGVMEEKAAKKESEKISKRLDTILIQQLKATDQQETDFLRVFLELQSQEDFNEKVKAELQKIISLLTDPDKAEVPKWFDAAVGKVLAKDEELLEVFLGKFGELSSKSDHIINNTEQIMTAIETLGEQLETVNLKGERKIRETLVFLSKMPITGRELFGRDKELVMLS